VKKIIFRTFGSILNVFLSFRGGFSLLGVNWFFNLLQSKQANLTFLFFQGAVNKKTPSFLILNCIFLPQLTQRAPIIDPK